MERQIVYSHFKKLQLYIVEFGKLFRSESTGDRIKLDESKNDNRKGSECTLVMNLQILPVDLVLEEEISIMVVSSNVRLSGVYYIFRRSTEEWLWVLKQVSVGNGAGWNNCGPKHFPGKVFHKEARTEENLCWFETQHIFVGKNNNKKNRMTIKYTSKFTDYSSKGKAVLGDSIPSFEQISQHCSIHHLKMESIAKLLKKDLLLENQPLAPWLRCRSCKGPQFFAVVKRSIKLDHKGILSHHSPDPLMVFSVSLFFFY